MFPTEFQVSWLLGSGEEAEKINFQDGRILAYDFSCFFFFFFHKSPRASYPVSGQLTLRLRRRREK